MDVNKVGQNPFSVQGLKSLKKATKQAEVGAANMFAGMNNFQNGLSMMMTGALGESGAISANGGKLGKKLNLVG